MRLTFKRAAAFAVGIPAMAVVIAGGIVATTAAASAAEDPAVQHARQQQSAYCTAMADDATNARQRTLRADECALWTRELADLTSSTPTPSTSPTATQTAPPTASPTVPPTTAVPTTTPVPPSSTAPATTVPATTTAAPSPTPTSTTPPGAPAGPTNTGYEPTGVTLTDYTGPCLISVPGTVIDSKRIKCVLVIQAANVTVTRSWLMGISWQAGSFAGTDVTIDVSPNDNNGTMADGVSGQNFTLTRANIFGSNRGVYCDRNGTIDSSWIHGTEILRTSTWHASAVRLEQYCTLRNSTVACDTQPTPQDGGCSADMTMYPDFKPNTHNTVEGNLFVANSTGNAYCAYFGHIPSKPYGTDPASATYIVVRNNIFGRGSNGKCAAYGPADAWGAGRTGNVWENNRFDDGVIYLPESEVARNNALRRALVS